MLEGKSINLRIAEKEDIPLLLQWLNDVRFIGDFMSYPVQASRNQLEPQVLEHKLYGHEWVDFIVEKKDGAKIGEVVHFIRAPNFGWIEIGYAIIPEERNKGYCTEAIQILTDYLFLTKDIARAARAKLLGGFRTTSRTGSGLRGGGPKMTSVPSGIR